MYADEERLEELIARVLDGKPIDWAGAESNTLDASAHLSVTALRDVSRIAGFSRDLQRAGREPDAGADAGSDPRSDAGPDPRSDAGSDARSDPVVAPRPAGITLGDLATLLCIRAEREVRDGDRAAAGAAFRAAEILADQVGATPGSPLRSRIAELRARLS